MQLRPYRDSDLDAIFALDRVCFPPRFRFSRAMMRRVVGSEGAIVLLARDTGADGAEVLLGFCAAQVENGAEDIRFGYVSTLDVTPESRGQGIGQGLMRAMHAQIKRAGGACMLLHVYVGNAPAIGLYEGLDYKRVKRERGFYGAGFDAWLYRMELG